MDWLLLLLIPVALAAPILARRLARRAETRGPDDSPAGYVIEAANHTDGTVFVTCIDGRTRQGRDLAPGTSAVVLDSRSYGMFRPTWQVKIYFQKGRKGGAPVYLDLFGNGLPLEISRRATPGTQHVRVDLMPDAPTVDGPARRMPASR